MKRRVIETLKKGDKVKIHGWKAPRELVEVYEKGQGWLAGLFAREDGDIEYYVITEDQIAGVGRRP